MNLRLLIGTLLAGALVWLTGAPAAAHASLVSSDPESGAVLATLPDEITLTFNEPVRLESGGVTAFDASGGEWSVEAVSRDNLVIVTPVDDPGDGTVVISWKVTSEDGHEVGGALTFSVGEASATVPVPATPDAPTTTSAARLAAAAIAALGLLVSIGLGLRHSSGADLAWNVGLAGAVLLGPLHSLAADGRGLGGLTDWLAWVDGLASRSSLLVLAAYAVVAVARRAPLRALAVVPALGLVAGAAVTWPQLEPPSPVAAVEAEPSAPTTASGGLGDSGTAELTVAPGPGREVTLDLRLVAPDETALVPFAPPTVTVGNGDLSLGEVELTETGEGTYTATVTIPIDGDWSAQVSVRTSEFDNPVVVLPFSLG